SAEIAESAETTGSAEDSKECRKFQNSINVTSSESGSESGIRDDNAIKSRSIEESDDGSDNTDEEDDSSDDTSQNNRSLKKHRTTVMKYPKDYLLVHL
ncbi:hypothetical protein Tco_0743896, partial [Tanacetum coccineum]